MKWVNLMASLLCRPDISGFYSSTHLLITVSFMASMSGHLSPWLILAWLNISLSGESLLLIKGWTCSILSHVISISWPFPGLRCRYWCKSCEKVDMKIVLSAVYHNLIIIWLLQVLSIEVISSRRRMIQHWIISKRVCSLNI